MKKIITIVGARPQFVKAAVVSRAIAADGRMCETIVHTGQHFDANMSEVFFSEMEIPKPHYNLNISSLSHGAMTGRMLEKIEGVLLQEKPDLVLVYGDTNSTLAGALAAKKLHIKVAHVEAGLRSFNMDMPEEINRILTDRISDLLFCPTDTAISNLKREGFDNIDCKIIENGDVMQDAALFYATKAKKPDFNIPAHFALCTAHRAENTDDPNRLQAIFTALEKISEKYPVVLPLHPRTKAKLSDIHYDFAHTKIHFINPVGYLEMVYLLKNCQFVLTDSGGLQKEAYFFRKNCVTLRDETEWIELIMNGFNILAGANTQTILEAVDEMAVKKNDFSAHLYGNGNAGEIIVQNLASL